MNAFKARIWEKVSVSVLWRGNLPEIPCNCPALTRVLHSFLLFSFCLAFPSLFYPVSSVPLPSSTSLSPPNPNASFPSLTLEAKRLAGLASTWAENGLPLSKRPIQTHWPFVWHVLKDKFEKHCLLEKQETRELGKFWKSSAPWGNN